MWVVSSYNILYLWLLLLAYSDVVTVTSYTTWSFLPVVSDRRRRTYNTSSSTTCTVATKHYAIKSNKEVDIPDSDNDEIIKEDKVDSNNSDDETADGSLDGFQKARKRLDEQLQKEQDKLQEYDGYFLRDVIYAKWGSCYDVDFNRVDSFGTKL